MWYKNSTILRLAFVCVTMEAEAATETNCHLYIDDREDGRLIAEFFAVIEAEKTTGVEAEIKIQPGTVFKDRLSIGDYAICTKKPNSDELSVRMVFERKTWTDLCNSISHERWNNQKAMLLKFRQEYPDTVCIYIIESNDTPDSFYMHMADDLVELGITVVHTRSIQDTVKYLLRRRHRMSKSSSMGELINKHIALYKEFKGRKSKINPECFLSETLKIIPGITPFAAEAIAARYDSVADFVMRCIPNDLVGIDYKTNESTARIGEKRAKSIVSMLWSKSEINRRKIQRAVEKAMEITQEVQEQEKKRKSKSKQSQTKRVKIEP